MNISEVVAKLQAIQAEHGDITVMFSDPNGNSVWGVQTVFYEKVEDDDEYPEAWCMPRGFEFVELG